MTRQQALDNWKKISRRIYCADSWEYLEGLSDERDRIREQYSLTLEEIQSGVVVEGGSEGWPITDGGGEE